MLIKTSRDGYLATTPHGNAAGAAVLRELVEHPSCVMLFRVNRLVTLWALQQPQRRSDLLHASAVEALLAEIAGDQPFTETDPRGALVFLLGEMTSSDPDLRGVAYACMLVADWALANAAVETALSYVRAAALVAGDARYAWVAGRLHREHSRVVEAEVWFKAAYAIAAREHDWDTRARSLMSWGHVYMLMGKYGLAREQFQRALATAVHYRLMARTGEAHHYLFDVAVATSDHLSAATHSRAAISAYGPGHPRLPHFAHDLACYWMDQGGYQHALDVLLALLDEHFASEPMMQLLVTGSALRAAGGAGNPTAFDRLLPHLWELRDKAPTSSCVAQALLAAARGAASLYRWHQAERILVPTIDAARESHQRDTEVLAEALLVSVRANQHDECAPVSDSATRELARDTVMLLRERPVPAPLIPGTGLE